MWCKDKWNRRKRSYEMLSQGELAECPCDPQFSQEVLSSGEQAAAEAGTLQEPPVLCSLGRTLWRRGGVGLCCGGISPAIQTGFEANQKLCKEDNRYPSKPPPLPSSEMSYPSLFYHLMQMPILLARIFVVSGQVLLNSCIINLFRLSDPWLNALCFLQFREDGEGLNLPKNLQWTLRNT